MSTQLFAQKLNSIQIESHKFYLNRISEDGVRCLEDSSTQPLYSEVRTADIPKFHSGQNDLDTLINERIWREAFMDTTQMFPGTTTISNVCPDNAPEIFAISYQQNFISGNIASISIFHDHQDCCGTKGAYHFTHPITFDLVNKKEIRLADVFTKEAEAALKKLYYSQLKDYLDKSGIPTGSSLLEEFPFSEKYYEAISFDGNNVSLYQNVNYGKRSESEPIVYSLSDLKKLINPQFRELLK